MKTVIIRKPEGFSYEEIKLALFVAHARIVSMGRHEIRIKIKESHIPMLRESNLLLLTVED